ncbi:hypothetical protein [Streptomyces sp. NBC_00370]|uniref:hypothetical protein n=1 Tax=Streptomyces sp. NBC_00370 TaxID=2975728 RepID=UPI002E271571
MSFDKEWASARSTATDNVSMRLNSAPADSGGGGVSNANLDVNQDKLGTLGSAAYKLYDELKVVGNVAEQSTAEAAQMMTVSAFLTGAAMSTVHDTWDSQLRTLLDACANISNHLDYSASSHEKQEKKIQAALGVSKIDEYFK